MSIFLTILQIITFSACKKRIKTVLLDWYNCHKTKAVALSFLASFVVLSAFDVSTDFYQAYQHWDHK